MKGLLIETKLFEAKVQEDDGGDRPDRGGRLPHRPVSAMLAERRGTR